MQRDAEGTCAYGRGGASSEVILNHVPDVLRGIQESRVVHPAFLGKSQPRKELYWIYLSLVHTHLPFLFFWSVFLISVLFISS